MLETLLNQGVTEYHYILKVTHKHLLHPQSTNIPRVPQCLSPRPNWDPSPPLPLASVSSPEPKGEHTRLRVGRWGPISDDWRKSLELCIFCAPARTFLFPLPTSADFGNFLWPLLFPYDCMYVM